MALLCGCGQVEIEPLSSCPPPHLEYDIDRSQTNILKDVSKRAAEGCAARPYGCSIFVPRKTKDGYLASVFPVAEQIDRECSYASDTQTYYHYDANGRFLSKSEGSP